MSKNHARMPKAAIEEIKRVWQAGMSATQIAAVVNPDIVLPKKATILNIFSRYSDELKPCHLRKANKPTKKIKPIEEDYRHYPTYRDSRGVTLRKIFND